MNPTVKRILLGIISSLLLATGFAQAAERLDPLTAELKGSNNSAAAKIATDPTSTGCNFADESGDDFYAAK